MARPMLIASVAALAFIAAHPPLAADAKQMEENKKAVAAFYDAVLNQKDFDAASKYLGNRYTQHNPGAADGPDGLKGFIAFLKDKFPNNRSEIKRIFADGDYVIVHVHAVREPGTRGNAIIDIFKLENGKVVEHWDVVQPNSGKARQHQRNVLAGRRRPDSTRGRRPGEDIDRAAGTVFNAIPAAIRTGPQCSSISIPARCRHGAWSSWVLTGSSARRARGSWQPTAYRCWRWGGPRPTFSPPEPQRGFPTSFGRTMPSW